MIFENMDRIVFAGDSVTDMVRCSLRNMKPIWKR